MPAPTISDIKGTVQKTFGITPNRGSKPEGMSQLFWDYINNSPEAEAIRKTRRGVAGVEVRAEGEVRDEIDRLIAQKWKELSPEKQQEFHTQDKKGSKAIPGTDAWKAEGRSEQADELQLGAEADFSKWQEEDLAELDKVTREAAAGNQEALARLRELHASIEDPEIKDFVGGFVSQAAQAAPSAQALADQRKEYLKLSGLTDPTITAEERLMQEMSRRQQEQDLRSQRDAFANQLQARGMYGSGAELTMNLASSQEAAQRRAYDEMQAQAHAQSRAMEALSKANEVAGNIRTSEAQESQFRGTAADSAAKWNQEFRDAYDKWKTEEQRRINADTWGRDVDLFTGTTGVNRDAVAGQTGLVNNKLGGLANKYKIESDALGTAVAADRNASDIYRLDEGAGKKFYGEGTF